MINNRPSINICKKKKKIESYIIVLFSCFIVVFLKVFLPLCPLEATVDPQAIFVE